MRKEDIVVIKTLDGIPIEIRFKDREHYFTINWTNIIKYGRDVYGDTYVVMRGESDILYLHVKYEELQNAIRG